MDGIGEGKDPWPLIIRNLDLQISRPVIDLYSFNKRFSFKWDPGTKSSEMNFFPLPDRNWSTHRPSRPHDPAAAAGTVASLQGTKTSPSCNNGYQSTSTIRSSYTWSCSNFSCISQQQKLRQFELRVFLLQLLLRRCGSWTGGHCWATDFKEKLLLIVKTNWKTAQCLLLRFGNCFTPSTKQM